MDEFTLTITLGNAEMSEPEHVAEALRDVASKLDDLGAFAPTSRRIMDVNGHTVGDWTVRGE